MSQYTFFWGCQIPARLPFIEKGTRLVLKALEQEVEDLDGFTCCPERAMVKVMDDLSWHATAARNISLAERAGKKLVIPCNGCNSVLKTVQHELESNQVLRQEVEEVLGRVGINYQGTGEVMHIIEFFHDILTPAKIKSSLKTPLKGMKIAVHYGCHLMRPSYALGMDDPFEPQKFDRLIQALGAQSLAYETKLLCCGEWLNRADQGEESLNMAREKLRELNTLGADAITMACPACFMQYDTQQMLMQRDGENIHVPVLYYTELLGLALGISPLDLGLSAHRVDVTPFLEKWQEKTPAAAQVQELFDYEVLLHCTQCNACLRECPANLEIEAFAPDRMMKEILAGRAEELINSPRIWYCLECHTCAELCPQVISWEHHIEVLKHLAVERGIMPKALNKGLDTFLKTARLGEPLASARKKFDLPPFPQSGWEDWKQLWQELEKIKKS